MYDSIVVKRPLQSMRGAPDATPPHTHDATAPTEAPRVGGTVSPPLISPSLPSPKEMPPPSKLTCAKLSSTD